jgi:hypothetical protein
MAEKRKNQDDRPQIHIEGGVHASRDVIMGDQYNQVVQNVEKDPSPAEFIAALRQAQQGLANLKQQPGLTAAQARNLEAALASVQAAEQKASQPEPVVEEIKAALKDAKETIDLISGSLASAAGLGVLIANLIGLVGRAFGLF